MILLLLAFLGGILTIISPCILPVLPFVFAKADQPFRKSGLPLLAGMAITFRRIRGDCDGGRRLDCARQSVWTRSGAGGAGDLRSNAAVAGAGRPAVASGGPAGQPAFRSRGFR